jgi:hypothetical protein
MSACNIEAGIPLPKLGPPEKYPFNALGVMESFFVDASDEQDMRRKQFVLVKCGAARKGKKFTTRIVREGRVLGVRVWRLE